MHFHLLKMKRDMSDEYFVLLKSHVCTFRFSLPSSKIDMLFSPEVYLLDLKRKTNHTYRGFRTEHINPSFMDYIA
jgi:hypothetical protein